MRKEFKQKLTARVDGRPVKISARAYFYKMMMKDALAGDKAARRLLWAEATRLFPENIDRSHVPSMSELNASDERSLAELRAILLAGLAPIDDDDTPHGNDSSAGDEQ